MKSYLTTLLFFVIGTISISYAQVDSTKLFYAPKLESAAFAEFGSSFVQYNGEAATNVDFSINWLINHKIYIGGVYQQLASVETDFRPSTPIPSILEEVRVKQQSAGARVGYIFLENNKIISIAPEITGGWSAIKWRDEDSSFLRDFGFISPAAKFIFNVSDYFRVGAGVSYHAYIGLDKPPFSGKQLSGIGGGLFLRLGTF